MLIRDEGQAVDAMPTRSASELIALARIDQLNQCRQLGVAHLFPFKLEVLDGAARNMTRKQYYAARRAARIMRRAIDVDLVRAQIEDKMREFILYGSAGIAQR